MFSVSEIATIVRGQLAAESAETPRRIVHDSRCVEEGDLFVALRGAQTDGHAFLGEAFERGACGAILTDRSRAPKSAHDLIVVVDPLAALQTLASAWRERLTGTIVAVTGSNGKTTTRSFLAHLLRGTWNVHEAPDNYNTEVGLPLALLAMPSSAEVGVFELGTEAPGEIGFLSTILRPTAAILTGVGPSHLAGFGSLDAIAEEKWSLIDAIPPDGLAFVNGDSARLLDRAEGANCELHTVGLGEGRFRGRVIEAVPRLIVAADAPLMRLETKLVGRHNAGNVLLAAACALRLGLPAGTLQERARGFEPLAHRLQPLRTSFGVVLDDTYNANPASTKAALHVLAAFGEPGTRRVFVFGDMLGLGDVSGGHHREILDLALELGIDVILPVGDHATAACRSSGSKRLVYAASEERLPRLRELLPGPQAVVLVKGSRALGLETLVAGLLEGG